MATVASDPTYGRIARLPERLCDVAMDGPGFAMLLELFRRTVDGHSTEVCDLISMGVRPVAVAYDSLDRLIFYGLIRASDGGRRFRRLELSPPAFTAIRNLFQSH